MGRSGRWALVDQVLANASNALLVFLIAGGSSPQSFGRFAVGYATLAFAVGVWRNGLSYQVSLTSGSPDELPIETGRAVAASLAAAPAVAIPVLLITGLGSGGDAALAWGLALAVPFVLTQDTLRFSSVAAGDGQTAVFSDAVWGAFLLVAVALRFNGYGATPVIALWLVGAITATAVIMRRRRVLPLFRGSLGWIAHSWKGRAHLVAGSVVAGLSVPVTAALVAMLAGPDVTGGLAGAGLLMAPTNSLVAFLGLTLIARSAAAARPQKRGMFARAGLLTAALTLVWGLLLLFIPDPLGAALLGDTWYLSKQALPVIGPQYAVGVLAQVATLRLVSAGSNRAVHVTSWVLGLVRVTAGATAALAFGTVLSVATGEACAMLIWLACTLWFIRRIR